MADHPGSHPAPTNTHTPQPTRQSGWAEFLQSDAGRAGLMQFGISLMTGSGQIGGNFLGEVGSALGDAGGAVGRVQETGRQVDQQAVENQRAEAELGIRREGLDIQREGVGVQRESVGVARGREKRLATQGTRDFRLRERELNRQFGFDEASLGLKRKSLAQRLTVAQGQLGEAGAARRQRGAIAGADRETRTAIAQLQAGTRLKISQYDRLLRSFDNAADRDLRVDLIKAQADERKSLALNTLAQKDEGRATEIKFKILSKLIDVHAAASELLPIGSVLPFDLDRAAADTDFLFQSIDSIAGLNSNEGFQQTVDLALSAQRNEVTREAAARALAQNRGVSFDDALRAISAAWPLATTELALQDKRLIEGEIGEPGTTDAATPLERQPRRSLGGRRRTPVPQIDLSQQGPTISEQRRIQREKRELRNRGPGG